MAQAGYEIKSAGYNLVRSGLPFRPPVARGLKRQFIFGQDMTLSQRDYGPDQIASTLIDLPNLADYYAVTNGNSKYFDTGLADTATGSFVYVGRSGGDNTGAAQRPFHLGSLRPGATSGRALFVSGLAQVTFGTYYDDAGVPTLGYNNIVGPAAGGWACFIATWSPGSQKIYRMDNATSATTAFASQYVGTNSWVVGHGSTSIIGPTHTACTAIHDVVLDATERDAIYAFWKAYYARRSIAI